MFRVSYLCGPHKAVRHRDFVSLEDALQYIRKRFLTGLQQIKLTVLDKEVPQC